MGGVADVRPAVLSADPAALSPALLAVGGVSAARGRLVVPGLRRTADGGETEPADRSDTARVSDPGPWGDALRARDGEVSRGIRDAPLGRGAGGSGDSRSAELATLSCAGWEGWLGSGGGGRSVWQLWCRLMK